MVRCLVSMVVQRRTEEEILKSNAARALGIDELVCGDDNMDQMHGQALSPTERVLRAYTLHVMPLHGAVIQSPHSKAILSGVDPGYWLR